MKAFRVTLVLLLVFALASACTGQPKPPQETDQIRSSETTEAQLETKEPEIEEEPQLVWSLQQEEGIKSIAAFGQTIAVGDNIGVNIYHLSDGSLIDALPQRHTAEDIGFSTDGKLLAAGLGVWGVYLTQLTGDAEPQQLIGGFNGRLAFSPDGLHIATGNRDGIIWIFELDGLTEIAALENPDFEKPDKKSGDKMVSSIDYHPSGKLLAATHFDGAVYFWDLEKKEIIRTLQTLSYISSDSKVIRFSPKGKEIACVIEDNYEHFIQLITLDDGKIRGTIAVPGKVNDFNYSPDGSLLAVASSQATTIYDVDSGELLFTLDQTISTFDDMPTVLTFTSDGRHLALAFRWAKTIELWELPVD
ncbi:MAG: hypothetical protein GX345_01020 [Clostridiales bacterium]|nr:hypothetical protein [Clostridiales bacterium]